MGICASSEHASKGENLSWKSKVNIVELDGKLQQLKEPTKAWVVLSQNPNSFICSSESMFVGSLMLPLTPNQELQLGHIYFLIPRSKSRIPLSLEDLCQLTVKADAVLAPLKSSTRKMLKFSSHVSHKKFKVHPVL